AYQLGNLASSASSTIETTIGERFPMPELGEGVYDYSKVMSIFMGCVFGYLLIVTVVGPENRNGEINLKASDEEKLQILAANKDTHDGETVVGDIDSVETAEKLHSSN
ncbi:hypothetical protein WICPIJ_009882, partial [Wickerhamomyces pijperi]